jgi:uncharacterized protein YciI
MSTLLLPLLAVLAAPTAPPAGDLWWVFLTKGPRRDQPESVAEQGQKDHIANLERLGREGHLFLAGPVGSDGAIRGTALVRAPSRDALMAHFGPDPFVQWGRLTVDAVRWSGDVGSLGEAEKPFSMEAVTLAILKKGPRFSEGADSLRAAHRAYVARLMASGVLALAGGVSDGGDRQGIGIFRIADLTRVQALLDADPAVKAGHYAVELHPQFLGKGLVGADHLAAFGWLRELAGSCWSAMLPGGAQDTQCYDAQYGRYLRGTIRITRPGKPAFEGDSVLKVDADARLRLWSWGSGGRTATTEVDLDGELVHFLDAPREGAPAQRSTWSRADVDGYRVSRQEKQADGSWKETFSVAYTRVVP